MKRPIWIASSAIALAFAGTVALTGCENRDRTTERGATSGTPGTPSPRGTETAPGNRPAPGTPPAGAPGTGGTGSGTAAP